MPTRPHLELVILKEKEYRKIYNESFQKPAYSKAFTGKMHRAEFDKLDRELRKALSAHWEEDPSGCLDKDFAMMHEREAFGAWHHCGAIHTNRICSAKYVQTISDVMARLPHSSLWTYHTSCELKWREEEPLLDDGEFFVRNGKLYVPKDGNDYAKILGKGNEHT
jgi:hypothetical protein